MARCSRDDQHDHINPAGTGEHIFEKPFMAWHIDNSGCRIIIQP